LGVIDYLTGFEISFSLFYLIPVSLVAWTVGQKAGVFISFAGAIVWLAANLLAGQLYSGPLIPFWNMLMRLGIFLLATLLLVNLRRVFEVERDLARTDFLTSALNSRAFTEAANIELQRSRRYERPLTAAYIDLDDFKLINDRFGHSVGDTLLKTVARVLSRNLRVPDMIARLGGDEFVLLLPETGSKQAQALVSRLQKLLQAELAGGSFDVTFSIGVITFRTYPADLDELLGAADQAMYSVKNNSKNGIEFTVYDKK
ncbi:MAG TPA: GGDEF domain-containing protein, partial [Anaerolineales bacterium]